MIIQVTAITRVSDRKTETSRSYMLHSIMSRGNISQTPKHLRSGFYQYSIVLVRSLIKPETLLQLLIFILGNMLLQLTLVSFACHSVTKQGIVCIPF